MDGDLKNMTRDELVEEVKKLREGIRKPQFMEGCIRYRKSLDEQLPEAKRTNETFDPLNKVQNVLWQSVDNIGLEYLQLSSGQNEIHIDSILICVIEGKPARITYQIRCDNSWQFQKLNLTVDTEIKQTLSLEITSDGHWINEKGRIIHELDGCLEPDILLTGFTNTLPIRRLNLKERESAEIKVAYINIPELTVVPIPQRYTCFKRNPNGALFHYENMNSGFETDIPVDKDFLVTDYPDLFRRINL